MSGIGGCVTRLLAIALVALIALRLFALVPPGAVGPLDTARALLGGEEERARAVGCLYGVAVERTNEGALSELLGELFPSGEACADIPLPGTPAP